MADPEVVEVAVCPISSCQQVQNLTLQVQSVLGCTKYEVYHVLQGCHVYTAKLKVNSDPNPLQLW